MFRALLVLLMTSLALPASATWHVFGSNSATAVDFRSPHQGVLSLNDATHLIQVYQDGVLTGVFPAPDVVTGLIIQDSMVAWATVKDNGLYLGTKHWSSWRQTSAAKNLTLVASTTNRLFLYSLGQLYFTTDGSTLTSTNGIPKGDSIAAIDYFSNDILLAVSAATVYRSTDAGENWVSVSAGMHGCQSVYVDRVHGLAYAGADTVRKSSDGGVHWIQLTVPAPFAWTHVCGYVTGAHDCSGAFYLSSDTTGFDYQLVRSTDGGKTFEDVGVTPPLLGDLRQSWTFDRGSTLWWWSNNTSKGITNLAWSDDGLNGAITDSLSSYIAVHADTLFDTACGAAKQSVVVQIASGICASIRLDSILLLGSIGVVNKTPIARILNGDTATVMLPYTPEQLGIDTVKLRLILHGLEWKYRETIDFSAFVVNNVRPPVLAALQDLDFGAVPTDSAKTIALGIRNDGCAPLRVDSIVSTNTTLFQTGTISMPLFIRSDSTLQVPVTFTPQTSGPALESIEIGTNAGHRFVQMQGSGRKVVSEIIAARRQSLSLYPNPAANVVTVQTSDEVPQPIVVCDLLGREVLRQAMYDNTLDVSMLAQGPYIIRIGGHAAHLAVLRP